MYIVEDKKLKNKINKQKLKIMKKITQIIMTLLMVMVFTEGTSQTLTVEGTIIGANGVVSYSLSLDNGVVFQSYNSNPNGAFSESFNTLSTSGIAIIQYVDCNGVSNTDTTFNIALNPMQEIFDFGFVDFCPNSGVGTSTVSGIFSSITSPVTFTITLDNGITENITTTPNGAFNESYNFLTGSVMVYLQYMNCNGDSIFISVINTSNIPGNEVFDFGTIDYCPNTNPTLCSAGFSLDQNIVIDTFNNVVSSGNVMVVNTSTGQNLTHTWDFGDNSQTYTGLNFTHTYASAGPWTLCLTVDDGNGCSDTYCDSLMVDTNGVLTGKTNGGFTIEMGTAQDDTNGPNSINDLENNIEVILFPNPAINELSLKLNSKISDNATITIYNALGSMVAYQTTEITTGDQTIKINIDKLNTGLFIIQLKTNNGTISNKLIKK